MRRISARNTYPPVRKARSMNTPKDVTASPPMNGSQSGSSKMTGYIR